MICKYCNKREVVRNSPTCRSMKCKAKRKLEWDREYQNKRYRNKKYKSTDRALLL